MTFQQLFGEVWDSTKPAVKTAFPVFTMLHYMRARLSRQVPDLFVICCIVQHICSINVRATAPCCPHRQLRGRNNRDHSAAAPQKAFA